MRLRARDACALASVLPLVLVGRPAAGLRQGAARAAASPRIQEKIEIKRGQIGRKQGHRARALVARSPTYSRRIGAPARAGSARLRAARGPRPGRPRRQARRARPHPGASCAPSARRLARLRARLAEAAHDRSRSRLRRALPGRHARPRHRRAELRRLRRPARARRVPAPHPRAGRARSSRTVRDARRSTRRPPPARLDRLERRQQQVTAIVLQRRNEIAGRQAGAHRHARRLRRARAATSASALSKVRDASGMQLAGATSTSSRRRRARSRPRCSAPAGACRPARSAAARAASSGRSTARSPARSASRARGHLHAGHRHRRPEGTPIRAADSGRVVLLGPRTGGYGNYTCVQHSAVAGHVLRPPVALRHVAAARACSKGQVIGYVGNTGHSFGAAPALRGARQRLAREPDGLPVAVA